MAVARLRAFVEKNALWVALGSLAIVGGALFVGVQVMPETFYDHYWWEDIYGPLVVDAHQCKNDLNCPGVTAPHSVRAVDGYTVKSELTYGVVLAALLYGIYVGLFRRYQIRADAGFVAALLPWMMLGPVARVLEDADVFCGSATVPCATPGPFSFLYISPVIYVQIALYVIGAMLLGLLIEHRIDRGARHQTTIVAVPLVLGLAVFTYLDLERHEWFSVLPPLWFMVLVCAGCVALFGWRASRGLASLNLTIMVLGLPFALGSLYLVGQWLSGGVWASAAWNGAFYREAGGFVLLIAVLVAALFWALARFLVVRRVDERWAALASKPDAKTVRRLGWTGGIALVLALLIAGVVPNLAPFFDSVPAKRALIPLLGYGGVALLLVFAFLEVGRGIQARPGTLLLFAAGINVALIFAHVMDGMATWVALDDPFGFGLPQYSEKHPFSEALLGYWGGFLYPVSKLVMVLVVVWLLDRETKEENFDELNLVGLVKMAIFALGFGPGLRDLLRLTMGV